jgi:hypothetical protein
MCSCCYILHAFEEGFRQLEKVDHSTVFSLPQWNLTWTFAYALL